MCAQTYVNSCSSEQGTRAERGDRLRAHILRAVSFRVVQDFRVLGGDFSRGHGQGGESIYDGFLRMRGLLSNTTENCQQPTGNQRKGYKWFAVLHNNETSSSLTQAPGCSVIWRSNFQSRSCKGDRRPMQLVNRLLRCRRSAVVPKSKARKREKA